MNMKAMFEAAQAASDFVTLTIDCDLLEKWEANPLRFFARIIGLTNEEAAEIAEARRAAKAANLTARASAIMTKAAQ